MKEVVGVALLGTVATSTSVANESDLTTNEQQIANVETSELVDEQWMVDVDISTRAAEIEDGRAAETESGGGGVKGEFCLIMGDGWCFIYGSGEVSGEKTETQAAPSNESMSVCKPSDGISHEITIKVGEKLPYLGEIICGGKPPYELSATFEEEPLADTSDIKFDKLGDYELTIKDSGTKEAVIKVHVVEEGYPNLATLASFTAEAVDGKVILDWITATEIDNAGFLVWRGQSLTGQATNDPNDYTDVQQVGSWINSESQDGMSGASYSYEDAGMVPGTTYYYALEDIDDNGKSTYHMAHIISVTVE